MNDFKAVSSLSLALLPILSFFPQKALAQLVSPAVDSPYTSVTTEGSYIQIEGGVQIEKTLFHRFDSFSLGSQSTADFVTPAAVQSVIGQVSGGQASYIDGRLQVSGSDASLYLLNPAGVLFGPNARLNLGGSLTVTTADRVGFGDAWLDVASTRDYQNLSGAPTAYQFNADATSAIVNQANLAVAQQQAIRLIGGDVVNTGTLSAPAGEISLTAVTGDSLVRLNAEGALLGVEVAAEDLSLVGFAAGAIAPLALPELLTGGTPSNTVSDLRVNEDGSVSLINGNSERAAQTVSSDRTFDAGRATVLAAGQFDVSSPAGGKGGEINLVGSAVAVAGARLAASGDFGGGTIRVGGDYQGQGALPTANTVWFEGQAQADALIDGEGGQVVVWSNGMTWFDGLISAQGVGTGKGGLVETSGLGRLGVGTQARVNTTADSGETGTWLLDPDQLRVVDSGGMGTIVGGTNSPEAANTIDAATLVNALNSTHVNLQASRLIAIDAAVDASTNAAAHNLSLQAPTLDLNAPIRLRPSATLTGTATTVELRENGHFQNAVDAVATGGSINLAAATYQGETVQIDRDMTLQGQGGVTIIDGENARRVLDISGGNVTLEGLTILRGSSEMGSGVRVQNANLTLLNSTVQNNRADLSGAQVGGGLHFSGAGMSLIQGSAIEGNTAGVSGGGIAVEGSQTLTIERSTISNNRAGADGGGLALLFEGNAALNNVTVSNNSAGSGGGGIVASASLGSISLQNSIVAGNTASSGRDVSGVLVSNGNNLIQRQDGLIWAGGAIASDLPDGTNPRLGPLMDNGGPTLTHALLVDSPAIDRATGASPDQRGAAANGPRDIGAYERQNASALSFISGGGQSAVVGTAFSDLFSVKVTDALGAALDGITVHYFSNQGPVVSSDLLDRLLIFSGVTNASGEVSMSAVANTSTGVVTVSAETIAGGFDRLSVTKLPDVASKLSITGPTSALVAGEVATFTVTALDRFNNVASSYDGLLSFFSSDSQARLLSASQFVDGVGIFEIEPRTAGTHTLTLSDALSGLTNTALISIEPAVNRVISSSAMPTSSPTMPGGASPMVFGIAPTREPGMLDTSIAAAVEDRQTEKARRLTFFDELAFAEVERSLTEEYAQYWQRPLEGDILFEDIQQLLQRAEDQYQTRSAVVYAVFVPTSEKSTVNNSRYPSVLSQRLLQNETKQHQDQLLLIMIPPAGAPIQQLVNVSREEISRQAKLFNLEISDYVGESYQPLAQQLYGWLLTPLEEDLQAMGVDNLLYVLDEGLRTIPLSAMMDAKGQYAIERYGLSMLPSVGLLQSDFDTAPAPQTVLAAGADKFSTLESLPAVPIELSLVEAAATASQVLLNEDFTIEALASAQMAAPKQMVHLATHAAFNPGAIDRSYIQLWDRRLSFDSLAELNLQDLELLMLSACSTATGSREAELGFAGIAAATGVEASVGTLWMVSDVGTMALMAEFYEQLRVNPLRYAALQAAQRSLIRGKTRIENNRLVTQRRSVAIPDGLSEQDSIDFSHPFFWSGFTLIGNPWW
ncbi:MAG: CHAT domain-containing protein [Phormidesmis sp.]